MEEIVLTNVRKSYGREVAVRNFTLRVEPGEFLTVLGPSGCGKTTTLRLIAGLEDPDEGEIRLGGRVVFSRQAGIVLAPEKRNLGLIFQSYALWPHMTVTKNIALALEQKKLSRSQLDQRVAMALEKVQLTRFRGRYPSELSGGQQQRVAVARLIATKPPILMMDEPLSNLDALLRTDMRGELKRFHRELGATTVYVTHDQMEALTLSDTIVVMNEGEVQQVATAFDIYHRPANLFVAEFIGNPRINRLEATLRQGDGARELEFGGLTLAAPADLPDHEGPVTVTIRPEDVEISEHEMPGALPARLDSVQPTGSETILQTRAEQARITVLKPRFLTMAVDQPLWLRLDPQAMNFFDPGTGRNLVLRD